MAPSLTAHAILRLLLSNFRPNEGIGKACNQSEAFLVETANSLALSLSEVAEARSKSNFLLHKGWSHSFWLEEYVFSFAIMFLLVLSSKHFLTFYSSLVDYDYWL